MKKWLVFYTKSRQEKKVNELLQRAGFEVLPTHKVPPHLAQVLG
jgi:hypothetical protein